MYICPIKYSFLIPFTLEVYLIDPISFHRGNIRNEFSSIEIFPPRVITESFISFDLPCKFLTVIFFIKFYIEHCVYIYIYNWVQKLLEKVEAWIIYEKEIKILSSSNIMLILLLMHEMSRNELVSKNKTWMIIYIAQFIFLISRFFFFPSSFNIYYRL